MYFLENLVNIVDLQDLTRKEWLFLRQSSITGSDIKIILGKRNYKEQLNLYNKKISNEAETVKDFKGYMEFGNRNEDNLRNIFSTIYDLEVDSFNYMVSKKGQEHLSANVDGIFKENNEYGILEIKTGNYNQLEFWEDDKIPKGYLVQVLHYLNVFGLRKAYIFGMIGGDKEVGNDRLLLRREVLVENYKELIKEIEFKVNRFVGWLADEFPSKEEFKEINKEG